jgi:hypothetical protein
MRNYYEEFLKIKTENSLEIEVSKVPKAPIQTLKRTFGTFDTPLLQANHEIFISKEIISKCSNCGLEMVLIENGRTRFCPLGCQSIKAN